MACLQLVAELRLQGLGGRPEAVRALGALLGAQLRQVGQGPPGSMVAACPHAARMRVGMPCMTYSAVMQGRPQKLASALGGRHTGMSVPMKAVPAGTTMRWGL